MELTLVATATTFGLDAEIQSPIPACISRDEAQSVEQQDIQGSQGALTEVIQ